MPHLVLIFRVWIHLCGSTHTNRPTSITTEEPKSPPWRRNQRHQHHHQHQSPQPRPPQDKPERSSGRTATPQPQPPFNQRRNRRKEQETETRLVQSIQHFYSYPSRIYNPTSRRGFGLVWIQLFGIPLHAARRAMAAACRCPRDKPPGQN